MMMRYIQRLAGAYLLLRILSFVGGRWMRGGALLRGIPWLLLGGRSRAMLRLLDALGWLAFSRMRARRV